MVDSLEAGDAKVKEVVRKYQIGSPISREDNELKLQIETTRQAEIELKLQMEKTRQSEIELKMFELKLKALEILGPNLSEHQFKFLTSDTSYRC